ncbi:hypothetical protein [Streptomyces sp. G-G2]|uniref:hypothetical protein n=1 Tax=Streptomyces sp. G-G2 TaxID=3046201 RepID=UPI0024B8F6B4|nr:hypothetical protein [Streptomyces sp. G-G2]MDJ0382255.1 hypothetical protein [Streptomyces sp. G-G2]
MRVNTATGPRTGAAAREAVSPAGGRDAASEERDDWADRAAGAPRLLFVENRAEEGGEADGFRSEAVTQVLMGNSVMLFLVQGGVVLAVPGRDTDLDRFQREGGLLAADRFSLEEHGLAEDMLLQGTRITGMDEVAGWILDPSVRVMWH